MAMAKMPWARWRWPSRWWANPTARQSSEVRFMQPKIELLDGEFIDRILAEAFELLERPGVKVQAPAALELLASSGARVETTAEGEVAHIPETLARRALETAPREFFLYDRAGKPAVHYGGKDVHFDPGSSCVYLLDPETLEHRPAQAADLVRLVQTAEMLPQYAAQSTAMVCGDVAAEIGDLYRLFLVLWHSNKPVVTGGFSAAGGRRMLELLALESGSHEQLRRKPRAVFDVCPSPPLTWTEFAALSLIDLARAGVPAEIISMPLAGAAAPVTQKSTRLNSSHPSISYAVFCLKKKTNTRYIHDLQ